MSPEDIKTLKEAIDIHQAGIDLERRKGLNQAELRRRFYNKDTKRIVLDTNIVTVSQDQGSIKVHTSPLDGVYKSTTETQSD